MSDSNKLIQVQLSNIERNYSQLQSKYDWKPLSETSQQFIEKFGRQYDEKASLIYPATKLGYISTSQQRLGREVLKPLKQYGGFDDDRDVLDSAQTYRYGQSCNKSVERPKHVIFTDEQGFARLIDPYVTSSMRDIVPHRCPRQDIITFWNWHESEAKKTISKEKPVCQSRLVVPISKHKLHKAFVSEMRANYEEPVEMEFRLNPTLERSVVLEPTDRIATELESATYGSARNCAAVCKQRRYE